MCGGGALEQIPYRIGRLAPSIAMTPATTAPQCSRSHLAWNIAMTTAQRSKRGERNDVHVEGQRSERGQGEPRPTRGRFEEVGGHGDHPRAERDEEDVVPHEPFVERDERRDRDEQQRPGRKLRSSGDPPHRPSPTRPTSGAS
jgi:hypothetical protein